MSFQKSLKSMTELRALKLHPSIQDFIMGKPPDQMSPSEVPKCDVGFTDVSHIVNPITKARRTLNVSQVAAMRHALKEPFSLIQGPPGTGKTEVGANLIVYLERLWKTVNGRVLVCAPSNTAVDNLAKRASQAGLKVIRMYAKRYEDAICDIPELALHLEIVRRASGEARELLERAAAMEWLSHDLNYKVKRIKNQLTGEIFDEVDIICCTCTGAGDLRLEDYRFECSR